MRTLARWTLAVVWLYQGLVPKLLRPDTGEVAIFQSTGLFRGFEPAVVTALGVVQVLVGLLLVVFPKSRAVLWVNVAALGILGAAMLAFRPDVFLLPFNPAGLLASMLGLSAIGLLETGMLPRTGPCETRNT